MKRKILSVFLLAAMVLTLFAGCEASSASKEPTTVLVLTITGEEAQTIVQEALGITPEEMLSPMIHMGTYGDPAESAYSIQFATLEKDYEFVVSAEDGEILYRSDEAGQ